MFLTRLYSPFLHSQSASTAMVWKLLCTRSTCFRVPSIAFRLRVFTMTIDRYKTIYYHNVANPFNAICNKIHLSVHFVSKYCRAQIAGSCCLEKSHPGGGVLCDFIHSHFSFETCISPACFIGLSWRLVDVLGLVGTWISLVHLPRVIERVNGAGFRSADAACHSVR